MSQRIIFTVDHLYPFGDARTLLPLAKGLVDSGFDVVVVTLGQNAFEPVLWKNAVLRNLSLIPWLVWGVLTFSLWQQGASEQVTAVITGENTILYSADSENASPRLSEPLPDGTEVEVLAERERWTEVQVGGRTGWLHAADLSLVPQ